MKYLLFFWISHSGVFRSRRTHKNNTIIDVNTSQAAKSRNKSHCVVFSWSTTTISLHTNRHWLISVNGHVFTDSNFIQSNSCIATCHSLQLPQARTAQVKEMLSQRSFWWTISLSKANASSQCLKIGDDWFTNEYLQKRTNEYQKDITCWNPPPKKKHINPLSSKL